MKRCYAVPSSHPSPRQCRHFLTGDGGTAALGIPLCHGVGSHIGQLHPAATLLYSLASLRCLHRRSRFAARLGRLSSSHFFLYSIESLRVLHSGAALPVGLTPVSRQASASIRYLVSKPPRHGRSARGRSFTLFVITFRRAPVIPHSVLCPLGSLFFALGFSAAPFPKKQHPHR